MSLVLVGSAAKAGVLAANAKVTSVKETLSKDMNFLVGVDVNKLGNRAIEYLDRQI
jgi:hypothetical protein